MGDELKETKNLFNLTKDENSVFYRVEKIKNNQLKKANKSNYPKDQVLSKLYNHRKILINDIMILFQVIHCLLNKKKKLIILLYLVFNFLLIYCMLILQILDF